MKTLVLFTLFTWASSVPLDWSPMGTWNIPQQQPLTVLNSQWQPNIISPAQKASYEIAQQIKLAEVENAKLAQSQPRNWAGVGGQQWDVPILAQQAAQQVLRNAVTARQGQTVEGIVDIEKQLQQNILGVPQPVEQVVASKAINGLERELQMLELAKEKIMPTTQLSKSLEAAIAAQLVSDNVEIEMERLGKTLGPVRQSSKIFRTRIEQLIDQSNIEEIKLEIVNQQVMIKQLQQQKQFVYQQLETILTELTILQRQGVNVPQVEQLQQVQLLLQQQEQQIVVSILARQQVIQQLEQALAEQQINLHHNVQDELVQEIQRWSVGPWSQRVGQTVPVWRSNWAPRSWSSMGNMRPQGNWIN